MALNNLIAMYYSRAIHFFVRSFIQYCFLNIRSVPNSVLDTGSNQPKYG